MISQETEKSDLASRLLKNSMNNNSGLSICPLASGSHGNSVFVSGGGVSILVDAGLSGVELERRMAVRKILPESLTAIVVTHEHTDHVKGAGILSRRYNIPLYINEKTCLGAAGKIGKVDLIEYFKCGQSFKIGDIKFDPFSISHDALDPAGLTLEHKNIKIAVATDMGVVTHLVKEHLKGCCLVYIEANHDGEMLMNGSYPWHLKQRIKGRKGHLSNQDTADTLAEIKSDTLSHVILAHLSEENNTPEKAFNTVNDAISTSNINLSVAMPHEPGKMIEL